MKVFGIIVGIMLVQACSQIKQEKGEDQPLAQIYIGTYTRDEGFVNGQSKGIQSIGLNLETGEFSRPSLGASLINPSFLARHPNGKVLFAVSELARPDEPTGLLCSYTIESDGRLQKVGCISTENQAPCHVEVDQTGQYVFVANYLGGAVVMYETTAAGSLTKVDQVQLSGSGVHERQDASHTHMVKLSPDNAFAYVPDLGANRIWCFRIDHTEGKMIPGQMPYVELHPGAGPRHLAFHPTEKLAFVINELDGSISSFRYDPQTGVFDPAHQISTLPEDFEGVNSCADIHVHPNGKFLYGSNRGHDSLVILAIDAESGQMSQIGFTSTGGKAPRNFQISRDGRFLFAANQDTDNIVTFAIDENSGELTQLAEIGVKTPVCISL